MVHVVELPVIVEVPARHKVFVFEEGRMWCLEMHGPEISCVLNLRKCSVFTTFWFGLCLPFKLCLLDVC